jgi:hypothetical protein
MGKHAELSVVVENWLKLGYLFFCSDKIQHDHFLPAYRETIILYLSSNLFYFFLGAFSLISHVSHACKA